MKPSSKSVFNLQPTAFSLSRPANSDREISVGSDWKYDEDTSFMLWVRASLVSRSLLRASGGLMGLALFGSSLNQNYGEHMWRKRLAGTSLRVGVVGALRDMHRAFSANPSQMSAFGHTAMKALSRDLQEEAQEGPALA